MQDRTAKKLIQKHRGSGKNLADEFASGSDSDLEDGPPLEESDSDDEDDSEDGNASPKETWLQMFCRVRQLSHLLDKAYPAWDWCRDCMWDCISLCGHLG